jgi:hypothetical protein
MPEPVHKIRITGVPVGEAPEWVREAWVGLELAVVHRSRVVTMPAFGVLSMPRSLSGMLWGLVRGKTTRMSGYLVSAPDAVDLLTGANPQAAQWWRDNTPHLMRPGRLFLFNRDACTPIG